MYKIQQSIFFPTLLVQVQSNIFGNRSFFSWPKKQIVQNHLGNVEDNVYVHLIWDI